MTVIVIFAIVAIVFALATLAYVAVDIILERKQKKEEQNKDALAQEDPTEGF